MNCEPMVLGDDVASPPLDDELCDSQLPHFLESLKTIEALAELLTCVKCFKLPEAKVFTLGSCPHKYCEGCIKSQAGKPCLICGEKGYPKDAKVDLFSSKVLTELPKIYLVLKGLQDMSSSKGPSKGSTPQPEEGVDGIGEGDEEVLPPPQDVVVMDTDEGNKAVSGQRAPQGSNKSQALSKLRNLKIKENKNNQKDCNSNKKHSSGEDGVALSTDKKKGRAKSQDASVTALKSVEPNDVYEFNECTPVDAIRTRDRGSPDVLEETPQNKVSVSIMKRLSSTGRGKPIRKSVRNLNFPLDEDKNDGKTEKQTDKAKDEEERVDEKEKKKKPGNKKVDTPKKPEEDNLSDEELFRTQQSCQGDAHGGREEIAVVTDLPVLTPYVPPTRREEQEEVVEGKPKSSAKSRRGRVRKSTSSSDCSSGEHDLPALTPHPESVSVTPRDGEVAREAKEVETGIVEEASKESVPAAKPTRAKRNVVKKPKEKEAKPKPPPRRGGRVQPFSSSDSNEMEVDDEGTNDDDERVMKSVSSTRRLRRASTSSNQSLTRKYCPSPTPSLNDSICSTKGTGSKEKRNLKGETTLHISCRGGQVEKVRQLLENGSDVDATDYAGWTPLHEVISSKKASIQSKLELIRILAEKNCNINAVGGPDEETSLHIAVQLGSEELVELLLELGASPNIRDKAGKLPKDVAFNQFIIDMLKSKAPGQSFTSSESCVGSMASNNDATAASTTFVEDDPAVLQVMVAKAVIFFNYDVPEDVAEDTRNILKLRVSSDLSGNVTHVIHKVSEKDNQRVTLSVEYLHGLARGLWQVSSEWIEKSINSSKVVSPSPFEILGHLGSSAAKVPMTCRQNHDKGNPGLFHGISFYLYKTVGFSEGDIDLPKKDLGNLITDADGKITIREPNPNEIDPLESLERFHAQSNLKFAMTTHIILYDDKGQPPRAKKYNLEHVKTLNAKWAIDSLTNFRLEDPESYL